MDLIWPRGIDVRTVMPHHAPSIASSSMYVSAPESLAKPSYRFIATIVREVTKEVIMAPDKDSGTQIETAIPTVLLCPGQGAQAVGMGQAGYEAALDYAKNRELFGQHLSDFQATQFKLADMAVSLDAARLLAYRSAWLKDSGQETVIKEASFAKLFATEAASRIINESLQIHGGAGLEKGARIERLYREVRALTIYEGTSEIQRQTIARQLLRE